MYNAMRPLEEGQDESKQIYNIFQLICELLVYLLQA